MVPGHEVVGNVVALGPGESKWQIGDRVGGPWHGGHDGAYSTLSPPESHPVEGEEV